MKITITILLFMISLLACNNKNIPKAIDNKLAESEISLKINSKVSYIDSLGWGYDIILNGKPYIHQFHIPALAGDKRFERESDAQKVQKLVVWKINKKISPPTVSVKELDSLGIK